MSSTAAFRRIATRVVVVASLALLPAYVAWRIGWTSRGAFAPLFLALVVAEAASIIRYLSQVLPALATEPGEPVTVDAPNGDVVVVVGAEPLLVVRTSIQAALRVDGVREVVVLDTIGRSDLVRYCAAIGVRRTETADALPALLEADLCAVVPASHFLHPDALALAGPSLADERVAAVTGEVRLDHQSELVGGSGYLLGADSDATRMRFFDRFDAAAPLYGPLIIDRASLLRNAPRVWDPHRILLDLGIAIQREGAIVRTSPAPLASRRLPSSEEAALRARARLSVARLAATRRSALAGLPVMQRVNYRLADSELFASATTMVAVAIPAVCALTGFLPLTVGFAGAALVAAPWWLLSGLARRLTDRSREPLGSHLRRVARTALVDLRVLGHHTDPVPSAASVASQQASTAMVLFVLCVASAMIPFTRFAMNPLPALGGALVLVAALVLLWLARDVYLAIEDRQHRSMARFEQTARSGALESVFATRSISPLGFDAETELDLDIGQRISTRLAILEADGSVIERTVLATVARLETNRAHARVYVEFEPDEALFDQMLYFVSVTAPRLCEDGVDYHLLRDIDLAPPASSTDRPIKLDLRWLHEEMAAPMSSELELLG